ncbi:MAG: hypothetical protein AAF648_17220 [Pseudomonadota bacterium]
MSYQRPTVEASIALTTIVGDTRTARSAFEQTLGAASTIIASSISPGTTLSIKGFSIYDWHKLRIELL